jgi:hypothetical protein
VLKDIQITLYDIFGYFLPGVIFVFALTVLFWALFWPTKPYVIYKDFSGAVIAIFVLIAYLSGHIAQGCGNFLEKLPKAKHVLDSKPHIGKELDTALRQALTQRFGEGAEKLPPREMYGLCDQSLVHHGSFGGSCVSESAPGQRTGALHDGLRGSVRRGARGRDTRVRQGASARPRKLFLSLLRLGVHVHGKYPASMGVRGSRCGIRMGKLGHSLDFVTGRKNKRGA